jgi:leader peptidase (prepilin peptidase)/N-methyltransferase
MDMFLFPGLSFFVLGTIIGSFLNVVIYRFNTGKSLSGRSHCLSCSTRLSWYELVPIFSYLAQRGTCRNCGAHITPRYLYVELLTGLLFLFTAQEFLFDPVLLLLNLGIVSLLVVILMYDILHTIIPDELVVYLFAITVVYCLWDPSTQTVGLPSSRILFDALLGGIILAAFLGGLWLVSHGRWIGLGDAKLAFPLGLILGAWESISMLMLAFWIGAVVSVSILVVQKMLLKQVPQRGLLFCGRRLTMRSEVPFAPFLLCAFFLVHLFSLDAFAIINRVTTLFLI